MGDLYDENRGLVYLPVLCILTFLALVAYTIRIYSRAFITRSIGSDDFAITISIALLTFGAVGGGIQFEYGAGRHKWTISSHSYAREELWEYIVWFTAFLEFFFLRASIMLFVLRLLPSYKQWQQYLIYILFFLNFAVTVIGCVTYGVSCIPFKAVYDTSVKEARCYSKDQLVIVTRLNAILSCVTDIITAIIPQFLIWNVKMKKSTKLQLNIIFGLGLVTSAMCIGRAATINKSAMTIDSTWRLIPTKWFTAVEERCGHIFACGPAIRQFMAYRKRTGTVLPSQYQQYPNEDFVKMRNRIGLRDIIWYRKAQLSSGRVLEATPILKRIIEPPPSSAQSPQDLEAINQSSVLDSWLRRIRNKTSNAARSSESAPQDGRRLNEKPSEVSTEQDKRLISSKYHTWGLLSSSNNKSQSNERSSSRSQETFLLDRSGNGSITQVPSNDSHLRPSQDTGLAATLADPIRHSERNRGLAFPEPAFHALTTDDKKPAP